MHVARVTAEDWKQVSEDAHLSVFIERKPASLDRIDFALVVEAKDGAPMAYATCREIDRESLYLQYGGTFPNCRGRGKGHDLFAQFVGYARKHYRRVSCLIENTNRPMLKLAFDAHFDIVGVRTFKGAVLLEHLLEMEEI